MWRDPQLLSAEIVRLLDACPAFDAVAVTMTGELADCFETRAMGVAVILEQVTSVIPAPLVRVYGVDGQWRSPSVAARDPWRVAASNWHALARWSIRHLQSATGILVDIGSTTTDIIPLTREGLATKSATDSQRLQASELVYTGIERSNVVGLVGSVPLFGGSCPVTNELFATTQDVYLWLGLLDENQENRNTADGRPATRHAARFRLARIVGEDGTTLADSDIDQIAEHIFAAQSRLIAHALVRVTNTLAVQRKLPRTATVKKAKQPDAKSESVDLIVSGHGDFLIEESVQGLGGAVRILRLTELLGGEVSRCAPAYAVALLAGEEITLREHSE
jgi:probable H4MPT-linked C1 transfer pathway protein